MIFCYKKAYVRANCAYAHEGYAKFNSPAYWQPFILYNGFFAHDVGLSATQDKNLTSIAQQSK